MTRKKQFLINLIAQVTSFVVTMGISMGLSPFIVRKVGTEAYGFVTLGNNFISYATIVTTAINSMAGRFVTIELTKKNFKKANEYFSSVFTANAALTSIFLIPAIFILVFLPHIVNVSESLVPDVRILWALIFGQFLLGLLTSVFSVATFATNKLYLSSVRSIVGQGIRVGIILITYVFMPTKLWYIGLAMLMMTAYTGLTNMRYTKRLTPELQIRRKSFRLASIKEIMASGIWNSVNSLGNILLESLDLLITNLFVDKNMMGVLAVSKTVPGAVSSLIATLVGIFVPSLTIDFAKENFESVKKQVLFSMKVTGLITCLPVSILVVFGSEFYTLWQPTLDAKQLQVLSILSILPFMVSGTINVIYNIFTVTNHVKIPAVIQLSTGVMNTVIVLILVKSTSLGVYAVAGVSGVIGIIKNLFVIVPYGSKCLGCKKTTFYPQVFKCLLSMGISFLIGFFIKQFAVINGWISFLIFTMIELVFSLCVYLLICTNKEDRKELLNMLVNIIKKLKGNL